MPAVRDEVAHAKIAIIVRMLARTCPGFIAETESWLDAIGAERGAFDDEAQAESELRTVIDQVPPDERR